ncbi:MAG: 16S rRNA (adenine(1518)-N(6)/adenine(1519)-N(6))-dimethyltransferase RsmA [Patescibacteria group bacterium]|jgi:16S rRNA (adenine1518-N6/adenine1519-N6)-dimethyltransferase
MLYDPVKSLGQNFLLEKSISVSMVLALNMQKGDTIVEIGAGLGALTVTLADHLPENARAYAVEIDERFIGKLRNMFSEDSNLQIIHSDILTWLPQFNAPEGYKVIGSLPYNITSPIVHMIVKKVPQPSLCVLLVQKEVAEKVAARKDDASYISSFVQTFFDVEYLGVVNRDLFDPAPKVDGGIIRLTRKESFIGYESVEKYEGFLHEAFSHPRKMLNKPFTKEELSLTGVDGKLRPQNITPDMWVEMFKTLVTQQ